MTVSCSSGSHCANARIFWRAGYRNVIAAYGVNGFTADHWQQA
jgi:hypothetical protein